MTYQKSIWKKFLGYEEGPLTITGDHVSLTTLNRLNLEEEIKERVVQEGGILAYQSGWLIVKVSVDTEDIFSDVVTFPAWFNDIEKKVLFEKGNKTLFRKWLRAFLGIENESVITTKEKIISIDGKGDYKTATLESNCTFALKEGDIVEVGDEINLCCGMAIVKGLSDRGEGYRIEKTWTSEESRCVGKAVMGLLSEMSQDVKND
jgi:hypothetical protein